MEKTTLQLQRGDKLEWGVFTAHVIELVEVTDPDASRPYRLTIRLMSPHGAVAGIRRWRYDAQNVFHVLA